MNAATPYRPRPIAEFLGQPVDDPARPWLALRQGETTAQRQDRLSHTCWACGKFESDTAKLDEHEETHDGRDLAWAKRR